MKKKKVTKTEANKVKSINHKMVYRLKISLDESKPEIWRRVLVPGKFDIGMLHFIIQITMGWANSHLHEFEIKGKRYINPKLDPDGFDGDNVFDEKKFKLADLLENSDVFKYTYDFGDDWCHTIEVEGIEEVSEIYNYPICIGGANACPPEDCGGIHEYETFLENISDKNAEDYLEALQWVGGQFNPNAFDENRVNRDWLWLNKW